ncbi:hypothetical protein ARMGADRAFT_1036502 [Armillaria gallica]|uniref:Uncharacterized protein n=1 Tax=Armillaria gallica TaxID=47427 RepID=A0A2H3D809_ARMGA|nr:hypothetical protein ARMGADRAFT_1036502 [Armillaria gallica]
MSLNTLINYLPNLGQPFMHPNFTEISLNSAMPSVLGDIGEYKEEVDYTALKCNAEMVVETMLENIEGEVHFHPMQGDRYAISPALSMIGAGSPLSSCENPGTASMIAIVPARERVGKLDLPFIPVIKKGPPLWLYGDIYCATWYSNGFIVHILLTTREYAVFNAEFKNTRYHHVPNSFTYPPFNEFSSSWISLDTNCGHSVSLGWKRIDIMQVTKIAIYIPPMT